MTATATRLWAPTPQQVAKANLTAFAAKIGARHGVDVSTYDALWRWSIDGGFLGFRVRVTHAWRSVLRRGCPAPRSRISLSQNRSSAIGSAARSGRGIAARDRVRRLLGAKP
jgi:hypothetical protein